MKQRLLLIFCIFFMAANHTAYAQFSRFLIQLKNKTGTPFTINNPSGFLSQRAINRRLRYHIAIDTTDLPIPPAYLDSIRSTRNVTILNSSKWLNQVCIQTSDNNAINTINGFSFVAATNPIAARTFNYLLPQKKQLGTVLATPIKLTNPPPGTTDYYDYGQAYAQVHLHNAEFLHNHGFKGEGMQLAMMDGGFYHYLSLPTFDSVRKSLQVLGTWDFVSNQQSVNEADVHGMNCFSTIAANMPGSFIGTAPKAAFYLFRTEDSGSEYPVEEQHWAAAAERADSAGADVFSVSLGYNTFDNANFNYSYADMNGHSTLMAKAANLAARKGILVVAAAGNEGNNSWHYITTPADADNLMAVGAVGVSKVVAGFSSYGPNSSGQIKPDVAAVGVSAVIASPNTGLPTFGNGTSFACPIMAGVTTCLWQAFPEVNNMQVIDALHRSADKFTSPDNRTGYGIPDVKKAFVGLIKKLYQQQISIHNNCKTDIAFTVKAAPDMQLTIERQLPGENKYTVLSTQNNQTNFASTAFNYTDDLNYLPQNIVIKYRIKMSIAADTSFYLDSATVNYMQRCVLPAEEISVSPNPVSDALSVKIIQQIPATATIELYAINGQKKYSLNNQPVNGAANFVIPVRSFSSGIYSVVVFINNKKVFSKQIFKHQVF